MSTTATTAQSTSTTSAAGTPSPVASRRPGRRSLLGVGAVVAATAVAATVLHTGVGADGAMPRLRLQPASVVDQGTVVRHLTGVTALSSPATARGDREDIIRLAPYTTPIGAVVTARSSMEAYLTASLYDVHNFWSRSFRGWGFKAPTVRFQFPAKGEVRQSCGATNDSTMQYCSGDDTITFSQEVARNLWLGTYGKYTIKGTDDMSVSVLVAHEYGHNIEQELGWLSRITAAQGERGADCLAGVWARDAYARGILDDGDVNEALQAMDLLAEHPGQSDNGVHGTPAQRQQAFRTGWSSNSAANCVYTYLK